MKLTAREAELADEALSNQLLRLKREHLASYEQAQKVLKAKHRKESQLCRCGFRRGLHHYATHQCPVYEWTFTRWAKPMFKPAAKEPRGKN